MLRSVAIAFFFLQDLSFGVYEEMTILKPLPVSLVYSNLANIACTVDPH